MALLLSTSLLAAEAPPAKERLLVMDLTAEHGVDEGVARLVNDLVLSEFQSTGSYDVVGKKDIESMLQVETQKQLAGCTDDECLAGIGGALGARYLASGGLGRLGDSFLLTLRIFDAETARAVQRVSQTIEGDEGELIEGVKLAVRTLLGVNAATTPPSAAGEVAQWLPWAALGASALAAGVGGAFTVSARGEAAKARDAYQGTPAWRDAKDRAEGRGAVARYLFIGASGAGIAALVGFWLRPDPPPSVTTSTEVTAEVTR